MRGRKTSLVKIPTLPLVLVVVSGLHADTLLDHSFSGAPEVPLNGILPDANGIRPVAWNAGGIIAANGQVNDGTNTDQGLVFDLGLSWAFEPQSTYTATLDLSNLDNAILFVGFRTSNPSGGIQVQTQGTVFALRVREIAGSDNIGIFQWPGSVFTDGVLSYDVNATANFTLTLATNNLTDATVTVGAAQVPVDLSANAYRYFFAGFEDPTTGISDAKFNRVTLTGPGLPAMPQPRLVSRDGTTGATKIAWPTTGGTLYLLQRSTNLTAWAPVDSSDVAPFTGTGSEIDHTDTSDEPSCFYRVIRP
jgi:hypothetical protein